jgi:hypothetical protein
MKTLITVTLLAFAIGTASSVADTPASPPAMMSAEGKTPISKVCSEQADEKGLHKKDRQKFRTACIKAGGKTA